MIRNLLPLFLAMLFVAGTAFAQETPQPADGVVEAPASPEAADGSSDCCERMSFMDRMRARRCCEPTCETMETTCCDADPCCNQRMGFMARMQARRCCEPTCETMETTCCDDDPCCNQRVSFMDRMRARRCCEPTCETVAMEMPEMTTTAAVAPSADCGTCETECCKPRRRMMRRRHCCN